MDVYEAPVRLLLRKLHARDRSKWTIAQLEEAVNQLAATFPRAQLLGDRGVLLNDIRAATALGDRVAVLEGSPPKPVHVKGPRLQPTVPYRAGQFLRRRGSWGNLTEQDWLDFAALMGYDADHMVQARAALTGPFHAIRGWLEEEEQ